MHTAVDIMYEVRGSLTRPRNGWQGDIKMYIKVIGLEVVDWIHLT
jgi:hypothetical protein